MAEWPGCGALDDLGNPRGLIESSLRVGLAVIEMLFSRFTPIITRPVSEPDEHRH